MYLKNVIGGSVSPEIRNYILNSLHPNFCKLALNVTGNIYKMLFGK